MRAVMVLVFMLSTAFSIPSRALTAEESIDWNLSELDYEAVRHHALTALANNSVDDVPLSKQLSAAQQRRLIGSFLRSGETDTSLFLRALRDTPSLVVDEHAMRILIARDGNGWDYWEALNLLITRYGESDLLERGTSGDRFAELQRRHPVHALRAAVFALATKVWRLGHAR